MAPDEEDAAGAARTGGLMSATGPAELRALTSVRGIAAWFVVLYHIRLSVAGLSPDWVAVFAKGYLAVDFFFLLSGFVIWLTWGERLRKGGWRAVPQFLQKRVARIWPLHLFMLGCAVGLALLLAATGRANPVDYPFGELPLHILLLQNWGFTSQLAWNDPSWSISAELGAYLLFPLLALAIDWRRVPSWGVLAAIAALLILLQAMMADGGTANLGHDIARFGLRRCVLEFASGTAVAALWARWSDVPSLPAWASVGVASLMLTAWAVGALSETLAVPAAFAAILLVLALTSGKRGNPLEAGLLHYLGEISYATYLGHFLLFVVFKLVFVSDANAIPPLLVALYLVLVLGSSVALYHLVERPAQKGVNALRLPGTGRETARLSRAGGGGGSPQA
jgi:peptidoglycan/LPS O-acetylase OafA/YrhL